MEVATEALVSMYESRNPNVCGLPPGLKRKNEIGRGPDKLK